jgi:cytochrome b6-f complex iron-sulfur subunit
VRRRTRRADRFADAIADGDALPAGRLEDPDDVDAVRVAITLKGAVPAADLPSEEFVAKLRQDIADEGTTEGRHRLSRRALLGTAGAVAAGAAAGAAGVALDRGVLQSQTASSTHTAAQLEPVDGQWLSVATDTDLASGAPQRFSTPALVGFVTATDAGVVAVSAACTHLGCILQPNDVARRFDCPCHRTAFGHDGRLLFSQLDAAPPPLTRLEVRRQGGNVEVLVPRTV